MGDRLRRTITGRFEILIERRSGVVALSTHKDAITRFRPTLRGGQPSRAQPPPRKPHVRVLPDSTVLQLRCSLMGCLGIDTRSLDKTPGLRLLKRVPVVQNGYRIVEYYWRLEKAQRAAGA